MMKEIELDWKIALQVWWSYTWRCVAIILPVTFVIGAVIGVVLSLVGGEVDGNALWMQVLGGLISMLLSYMILRDVLTKRYKGFRLAVVKHEPEKDAEGISSMM